MNDANATPAAPSSEYAATSSLPVTVAAPERIGPATNLCADVLAALRFYTRLAIPVLRCETSPHAPLDFSRVTAGLGVASAGFVIGAFPGGVLFSSAAIGLPPLISALLALVAAVLVTGAFHEDGLADTADSAGGGRDRARRLEIMRDSRIGSYGAIALVLSLALRATTMAVLSERLGAAGAALCVIAIAPASRVAGLMPLWLLPPARSDGAAAAATAPTNRSMLAASALAMAMAALLLWAAGVGIAGIVAAAVACLTLSGVMTRMAHATLGGHTGDIAGAAQQLAEIGMLLVLVLAAEAA